MWELARPLIEDWIAEHYAPEAQLAEAVQDVAGALVRLPRLVAEMEETVGTLARGGLKLHPESVRALAEARAENAARWPIWVTVAVAIAVVVAIVF